MEGSPSWSRLKICVTAGITETAAERTRAVCYLKDAELWSRLLTVETHKEKKNIDDNMVIKIANAHMFLVDTLKNTCTYTLKHVTCQRTSAHQPLYTPLGHFRPL